MKQILTNEYLLTCLAFVIIAFIVSTILRWGLNKRLHSVGADSPDATGIKFLRNTITFIVWVAALTAMVFTIPQLRSIAVTLFAGAGLLVAIIGFAAQAALGNIISGVFIVMFKPFRVGDIINVGSEYRGKVTDITLRHTVIKDFQNRRIIMPNSIISSQTVVNDSIADPLLCRWVDFGISYESDIDQAISIIRDEAENHPLCLDNRDDEELQLNENKVEIRVTSLGEYSVNLRAFCWAGSPSEAFRMHTDLNKAVKHRFDRAGIEIPYPHRTIVYKRDLGEGHKA